MYVPRNAGISKSLPEKRVNPKSFGWRGIRTKTHTYVVDLGCEPEAKPRRLLYNNALDPYQMSPKELSPHDPEAKSMKAF